MFFRLSEDGRTQVNLALVRAVAVAPAMTGVGSVGGFRVEAHLQGGAHTAPVVLKTFAVEPAGDQAAEKSAAQAAMDYLSGLPTRIALEGVDELVRVIAPVMAVFDAIGKRGKAKKKAKKPAVG